MRKLFPVVILAFVAFVLGLPSSQTAPRRGDALTFGRYVDLSVLEPALSTGNPDIWILGNIMDTLVRAGPDGKRSLPGVAVSWAAAKDNLSYTFRLRPGVKFSNGAALTPENAKFSLERAAKKDLASGASSSLTSRAWTCWAATAFG